VILDASAIVAILRAEPEAGTFGELIERATDVRVSAATLLEASLVLGPDAHDIVDRFVERTGVEVVPFDHAQYLAARRAHVTYGRGSGSPARLNFGDCIAYALASVSGMTLLFKGDDFIHTDVTPALILR